MKRVEDKEKKRGEHTIRVTRGELFSIFLKAGLAFGGGLGILAVLEDELVSKRRIVSRDEFLAIYGIGRVVPSGTMTALAVAYGYKFGGMSAPVLADFGRVYFWARRYPEALEKYHKVKELGPGFGAYRAEADELYEQVAADEKYVTYEKLGWFMGDARGAYLKRQRSEELLLRLRSKRDPAPARMGAYSRAEIYARLGEKDKAFAELEETLLSRNHRLTQIKVNPKLDALRSDPRFAALLQRMKLGS